MFGEGTETKDSDVKAMGRNIEITEANICTIYKGYVVWGEKIKQESQETYELMKTNILENKAWSQIFGKLWLYERF